ncbi:MAG: DUF1905 domain-containing protein [Patescibacteria group bacterium]
MKEHIVYHKDGSIWAKGKMAGGKCEGYFEWFRTDGTIMRSGNFKKDKQVGKWTTYDKKGKVVKGYRFRGVDLLKVPTSSQTARTKFRMKNNSKIDVKNSNRKGSARKIFKFQSKVIVWAMGGHGVDKSGAWRFARVPEDISVKIKELQLKEIQKRKRRRGWGAVYAKVKIGKSEWQTSIFPDRHSNTYILPLKKQIRYEENLYDGLDIKVSMEIWF